MRRGMNGYNEEKLSMMNAFMVTLQISGYPEGFRQETALSAYKGVRSMEEKEAGGGRKVYCLHTEGAVARHRSRIREKSSWFKKRRKEEKEEWTDGEARKERRQPRNDSTAKKTEEGCVKDDRQAEGIICVPFTLVGKLRSCLQHEDDKLTKVMRMPRLRYIERPGRSVADALVEKDPW